MIESNFILWVSYDGGGRRKRKREMMRVEVRDSWETFEGRRVGPWKS